MLWPFTTSAHGAGPFWLQFRPSDRKGVIHSPTCFSMKTTSWAGAIRAKFICVVSACTRVFYSRAGFVQTLLAWLTSEPTCTNSFCPNRSRLPQEGSLWRNFVTPQVNMGECVQKFCSASKTTKLVQISIGLPERASKNASTERTSLPREL